MDPALAASCSSIALVLSVDSSGSVSDSEFELEKQGLAAALRNPEVQGALLSSGPIKLAALFWGDPAAGTRVEGWDLVKTARDADRFAGKIAVSPRVISGNTGIGNGLGVALDLLARPEACAGRRIVNITGDGQETLTPHRGKDGLSLSVARKAAEEQGVMVNGLVIADEEAGIAEYYRENVAVGSGSFVVEVAGISDYADAIRRKIMRETTAILAAAEAGQ